MSAAPSRVSVAPPRVVRPAKFAEVKLPAAPDIPLLDFDLAVTGLMTDLGAGPPAPPQPATSPDPAG